jgi:hypothetical protein
MRRIGRRYFACVALCGAVACSGGGSDTTGPGKGSLSITITGVPSGPAAVTLTGPGNYHASVTQTTTLSGLTAGAYTLVAAPVVVDSNTYEPPSDTTTANVAASSQPTQTSVNYVLASGSISITVTGLPNGVNPQLALVGGPNYGTFFDSILTLSRTIKGLKPGQYSVLIGIVAQGMTTYAGPDLGTGVVVTASLTPANVQIAYAPASASMRIVVDTIQGSTTPNLLVNGPYGYSHAVTKLDTTVLTALPLGTYTITGSDVRSATDQWHPTVGGYYAIFSATFRFDSFEVHHIVSSAAMHIFFKGLPSGAPRSVTPHGPNGLGSPAIGTFTSDTTIRFVAPGSYWAVLDTTVVFGGVTYIPTPPGLQQGWFYECDPSVVPCAMEIDYGQLDFAIGGLHAMQGSQWFDGSVPLVQGRDALVRVFPFVNRRVSRNVNVRLRTYESGTLVRTDTIALAPTIFDTSAQMANFNATANVVLPGALVQPGLALLADIDPGNVVAESSETNNVFPANGIPKPVAVQSADSAHVTLVPITIPVPSGGTGIIADRNAFFDFASRAYPVPGIVISVHTTYTSNATAALMADDANGMWNHVLNEIAALRTADNPPPNEIYYGVVDPPYLHGDSGFAERGQPVAVGWDIRSIDHVMGLMLAHNWLQEDRGCVHSYGWYTGTDSILDPNRTYDVMGVGCPNVWVSPPTWDSVFAYRHARGYDVMRAQSEAPEPALLVWGTETDGRLELEPAFEIETRPQMPDGRGAYLLEGLDENGGRVFSYAFTPITVAGGRARGKNFVFAIPMSQFDVTRLAELRVSGSGRSASVRRSGSAMAPSLLRSRSASGGRTALSWDAAAYPMALVRDANTGKVVSFARNGAVTVKGRRFEVTLSDGVRSVKETAGALPDQ